MHNYLVELDSLAMSDKRVLKHHLTAIDTLVSDQDELALAIYGKNVSNEYWAYRLKAAEHKELEKEGVQVDGGTVKAVLSRMTVLFLCVEYIQRSKNIANNLAVKK